ncbi:hypothetical protein [Pseudonocardia alaniniphila]|uniref:Lysylphosphatidylglycerol synthase-like protein n=1 Tax=Pseudonocardia alaniniphila TaxID=75291 RepID=A0ABS9TRV6_9PSEU|nr:hypothetical protein [Pseudonocardia alaniniphila]MCH6171284.1 hypothetical protein [Pseudonocardia alaniniphila]
MAPEAWPRRQRAAGWWLVRLVEVAIGMWVTSVLVAGLTLAPWPEVVLAATAYQALLTLARRALAVLDGVDRALAERALDVWSDSSEWLYISMAGTWWVFRLAVHGALRVGLLWAVVQALGTIGLSSRLEGFWPTIAAAVVLFAGAGLVRFLRLVAMALLMRSRRSQLSWSVAELPLTALALGGGVLLLPGVELAAGLSVQLLTVGVLATAITSVRLELSVPFLVLPSTFATNALKLWLVGLLSGWMTVPLRIDGLLSLTALALLVTALAWPAVRARRARQARQQALDAMTQHQQMMEMHQKA